jgi:hypothetical protein
MASKQDEQPVLKGSFNIKGSVQLEAAETKPDVQLKAFAFSQVGSELGSSDVDAKGGFALTLNRNEIGGPIQLVVGPEDDPNAALSSSSSYTQSVATQDWKGETGKYAFNPEIRIPHPIWRCWERVRVCVSGRIRKRVSEGRFHRYCPVPFVKVEVYDVDREWCWPWPWFLSVFEQQPNLQVARLPNLVAQLPPYPIGPDPGPEFTQAGSTIANLGAAVALNPQPLPPAPPSDFNEVMSASFSNVQTESLVQSQATLTSRIPFWELYPRCYYSTQLVCTTYTDCDGNFKCCFPWWVCHYRRGRFRWDPRPDIIIKVTQIIDGVSTVIYMDPFSHIRWNVTNTYINLVLDDADVVCGPGCNPPPNGPVIFFTDVGDDFVYDIEQTNGTYQDATWANVAYGGSLDIRASIGTGLSTGPNPFYYQVSFSKGGAPFQLFNGPLSDTRVDQITLASQSYALGPQVVAGVPSLYEIRNTQNYYWYHPDLLAQWDTTKTEPDHDRYVLRIVVFDHNGIAQTSATVDYLDGTVPPPGPLPPMTDHIDLVLAIDNDNAVLSLNVPAATNLCGVVPYTSTPFNIDTSVTQPNGRLFEWALYYEQGLSGIQNLLTYEYNYHGLSPLPRNAITSSAPFTSGLTTTCAFSLILDAWPLIRNGYGLIYFAQLIKAIAVEKCDCSEILAGKVAPIAK